MRRGRRGGQGITRWHVAGVPDLDYCPTEGLAKMPDQWEFKSRTYDNCNCDMNCGCQFNMPSTHGFCQTAYIGAVEEGRFNETPLAGLKWAGL